MSQKFYHCSEKLLSRLIKNILSNKQINLFDRHYDLTYYESLGKGGYSTIYSNDNIAIKENNYHDSSSHLQPIFHKMLVNKYIGKYENNTIHVANYLLPCIVGILLNKLIDSNKCINFVKYYDTSVDYAHERVITYMEKIDGKLSNFHKIFDREITFDEYLIVLFQIFFAISVIQHEYGMVHYDLHFDNILIQKVNDATIIYNLHDKQYILPKHDFVIKIIDFDWTQFKYKNYLIVPEINNCELAKTAIQFNYSFDCISILIGCNIFHSNKISTFNKLLWNTFVKTDIENIQWYKYPHLPNIKKKSSYHLICGNMQLYLRKNYTLSIIIISSKTISHSPNKFLLHLKIIYNIL